MVWEVYTELGRFLNNYLSLMTEIITKNKGMVDKYIGDAVMAVWGSPLDDPQHGANAVRTAIEMVEIISEHADQLLLSGKPVEIGIGINSGDVSAGNFGSDDRFDYTVLGDNVIVKGRNKTVALYEPLSQNISDASAMSIAEKYEKALSFYTKGLFSESLVIFDELYQATPEHLYKIYCERCREYMKNPPAGSWAGVYDHN